MSGNREITGVARRVLLAYAALTASMLLLGGIGSLVVVDSPIGDADADFVGWVADHRLGILDTLATVVSSLTDTWTVIGVLVGSVTVLVAAGHRRYAAVMLIGIGLEFTSFLSIGVIIDRSRPSVEALHSVPSTPSFPSGHVAAAVVLYGALAFSAHSISRPDQRHGRVWFVPAGFGLAVAAARVYEGVHFPTDVAAGFVLGAGALYAAAYTMQLVGQQTGAAHPTDGTLADALGQRGR